MFLEATFQRSDFTEEFLERMVALIHKTDDPKKSNLFAWVSDDVFTKGKSYMLLQLREHQKPNTDFATQFIVAALKCPDVLMQQRLDMLYKYNVLLFDEALKIDDLSSLVNSSQHDQIHKWMNDKKAKESKSLSVLSKDEILDAFEICRQDPEKVRVFLNINKIDWFSREFKAKFKMIADAMTKDELFMLKKKIIVSVSKLKIVVY